MRGKNGTIWKYAAFGAAFGLVFPLLAVLLRYLEQDWAFVVQSFSSDPLLWIICTAPVVLGGVFAIVGKKQQTVENMVADLRRTNQRLEETQREVEEALEAARQLMEVFGKMLAAMGGGQLDRAMRLLEELQGRLSGRQQGEGQLLQSGMEQLLAFWAQFATTLEEAKGSLERTYQLVDQKIQDLFAAFATLEEHISQAFVANQEVHRSLQQASANAEQSNDAVEQMSSQCSAFVQQFSSFRKEVQQIVQEGSHISGQVQQLEQQMEEVRNVALIIRDIAEHINLLSLNAAIEAARAGEAGRGFAVVAEQVQSLAERTRVSTEQITQVVDQLQQLIHRLGKGVGAFYETLQHTEQRHQEIQQLLKEFAASLQQIQQQAHRNKEIADQAMEYFQRMEERLNQIVKLIEEEAREFRELKQENQQLRQMMQQLERVIQRVEVPALADAAHSSASKAM